VPWEEAKNVGTLKQGLSIQKSDVLFPKFEVKP